MSEFTVQVNISPGDVSYAHLTVPALLQAHNRLNPHRMVVFDAIPRPGIRDEGTFAERSQIMRKLIASWQEAGLVDSVLELQPSDPAVKRIASRYTRPVSEPFDSRGAPITAYLLPLEEIKSGFWIHYDGDMLLSQKPEYDWAHSGAEMLTRDPHAFAVSPRISPPCDLSTGAEDRPSLHSGAKFERRSDHWRKYFFSARCFLVDVEHFRSMAPFVRWPYVLEVLARRVTNRTYPPFWEIMVHQSFTQRERTYRIDLSAKEAFLIHPADKGNKFIELLPFILSNLKLGRVPDAQRGMEDLDIDAWDKYINLHGGTK